MVAIKIEGYERVAVTGSDGKKTYTRDKGDNVAKALRGKNLEEVGAIMAENGMKEDFDNLCAPRDDGNGGTKTLNNGQIRMLSGQKLRSLLKREGKIVANGETIENDIPVKEPKVKTEAVAQAEEVEAESEDDEDESDETEAAE